MVKSESKKIKRLKEKMKELQQELKGIGPVMRGSIVCIGMKTKQYFFSLNKNQKTKIIFLGKKRVEYAKKYLENYKKLLDIIEKMTIINMEIMKKEVLFNAFFKPKS